MEALECTLVGSLLLIGAYTFAVWSYETFHSAVEICWGLSKQWISGIDLVHRYGQWAVITGGSEGIGRQYALFLAGKGLNVAIIAMHDEKLKNTAQEIESKFPVKVKSIPVDFSADVGMYDYLKEELAELDIGILVNNVGIGPRYGAYFDTFPMDYHRKLINVNVSAAVIMTHIVLPGMKQRRRGLLVNIASVSALSPTPTLLMYGATKAFMLSFSQALRVELNRFGVQVQTVTPNFVATSLTEQYATRFPGRLIFIPVETYGRFLTMTLGKTALTTGHWKHAIFVTVQKMIPLCMMPTILNKIGTSMWCENKK